MSSDAIVYLDASFITDAYERSTGDPVPTKVVKSEALSGGFSAGFANAGATRQEIKEFPVSVRDMYEKLREHLDTYPEVDLGDTPTDRLPDYFWAEAELSVASANTLTQNVQTPAGVYFLLQPLGDRKNALYMLTRDTYFSAGYDQVLRHVHGATRGFGITVRALVKLLALQESNHWPSCAPLVIVKTSSAGTDHPDAVVM